MGKSAYIAIDLGAESGRAMVGVLDDGKLELHEIHRFLHLPQRLPTGLHWNLQGLWANIVEGMKKSAVFAKDNGLDLRSIGVDTWGVDWGLISQSGELVGLPYSYRDERNPEMEEALYEKMSRERLYENTGIQFMAINTLVQVWGLKEKSGELFDAADKMLFMPDLFHYLMTGDAVVEATIASTSQMLDARTGEWAKDMLEELDIPKRILTDIVAPSEVVGELLPHLVKETGLPEGLKVVAPASHDTASAVAAVPADGERTWCYLSSGTWSLMGAELTEPCLTEAAMEFPFTNEGGVDGTIRFLKNISGLWLVQETRRYLEKQGEKYDYVQLTEMAEQAEAFRTLLDTTYEPFGSPGEMPKKIAAFAEKTGQPVPEGPGEVVRACLESLALTYRQTLDGLESVLGKEYEVLHLIGGGGQNRLLNQMTANALGRDVIVGPYEGTAMGNVLVQAMGMGEVNDLNGIREIVRNSFEPETYSPVDVEAWEVAYERFKGIVG